MMDRDFIVVKIKLKFLKNSLPYKKMVTSIIKL
jgi:hypothetical protein